MKKKMLLFLMSLLLVFLSCKTGFLHKEMIAHYDIPKPRLNQMIWYEKQFAISDPAKIQTTRHSLIKVGENLTQLPEVLTEHDGAVESLLEFQARIIHGNGKVRKYSKGKLEKVNLSNANIIQDNFLYYLPVDDEIQSGDLLEIVTRHENSLPFLGLSFSPAEIGKQGQNISCSFKVRTGEDFQFWVKNDTIQPQIRDTLNARIYCFTWENYSAPGERPLFDKRNREPRIFARISRPGPSQFSITSWENYGDTYLNLIRSKFETGLAENLARQITQNLTTPKEKMDAIAAYCQKNIRYEQVYLDYGELIPNTYSAIIEHKYGDCKDFSTAIYTLARSIGLEPNWVLCFRDRAQEFYPEIPVSQFNHAIVHFEDNGCDYWYDGTNRNGKPGLAGAELVHQSVLILQPGNSHIRKIQETPDDRLEITGDLRLLKKNLQGNLTIVAHGQDAIPFLSGDIFFNQADMKTGLYKWLQSSLNDAIQVQKIDWQAGDDFFKFDLTCEIPNSVIIIESNIYLSLARLFGKLLPESERELKTEALYYYPGYNRAHIKIGLENLVATEAAASNGFLWHAEVDLPAGPFTDEERLSFIEKYQSVQQIFNQKLKFSRKE